MSFEYMCRRCGCTEFVVLDTYNESPWSDTRVHNGQCKNCGCVNLVFEKVES